MKKYIVISLLVFLVLVGCSANQETMIEATKLAEEMTPTQEPIVVETVQPTDSPTNTPTPTPTRWSTEPDPLQIEVMRQQEYPGSEIVFEQTLAAGANYNRYVVSYLSDGYKIYALMTIPFGETPETGWPVIVFNHGYIEPSIYRTTERYVAYVDYLARNGYIVFKTDYRNHGNSEGEGEIGGGYGTPDYTNDALNALTSLQQFDQADPNRIGMWGHSMGGQVVLRAMVVSPDIKAGVIWGGVVAPYPDVIDRWNFAGRFNNNNDEDSQPGLLQNALQSEAFRWGSSFGGWANEFIAKYGAPEENPEFWNTISPNYYLTDLSGPIQLNQSSTDEMVPQEWSDILAGQLQAVGQYYEYYIYEGDNHNISINFVTAMQHTLEFFDTYVKGQPAS